MPSNIRVVSPVKRSIPDANQSEPSAADATRVLRQFRRVFNAVRTHFQRAETQSGLGGSQVWALSLIAANPGMGVTELSDSMDIRQSTASNLVKGLLDRGLVIAARDELDRRTVHLRALPSAAKLLACVPGPAVGILPQALQQLDSDTLARLESDLEQLLQILGIGKQAERTPLSDL